MSEFPKFWENILNRLGLQSFEGIENIRNVLNFMGYTTLQSISKLCKPKELSFFQIEAAKLSMNSQFCSKHPELQNWHLGHGTIAILKDISSAASSCMTFDIDNTESVKEKVFQRCIKIATNLSLSNVMVDLNGKARCEIICPVDSCKHLTKLSLIKQVNPLAPPKFNVYNFERHFNGQHLNKRKIDEVITNQSVVGCGISQKKHVAEIHDKTTLHQLDCDISQNKNESETHDLFQPRETSTSTPLRHRLSGAHSCMTPKTTNILQLRNELSLANEKIKSLENGVPITSSSSTALTPKSIRIEKLSSDLSIAEKMTSKLREENILLRHKCLDVSGKIRTVCRIKPNVSGDCFDWCRSGDNIEICKWNNSIFKCASFVIWLHFFDIVCWEFFFFRIMFQFSFNFSKKKNKKIKLLLKRLI